MKRLVVSLAVLSSFFFAAGATFAEESMAMTNLRELAKKHPESFEVTITSHYSDDDFGFHLQTAALPRGDYLYPRYRIHESLAGEVVNELGETGFAKSVKQLKRDARFRPGMPKTAKRVYSVVVRCGDFSFCEDVQSEEEIKKRADAITAAFKGLKIGASFEAAFRSKLGE